MCQCRKIGDMMLQSANDEEVTVADLLASPLAKFIHLAVNDCGYIGSTTELICNWIHPLFLKAKATAS